MSDTDDDTKGQASATGDNGKPAVSPKPMVSTKYEIGKLSIKLPPFWSEKPEIWFAQVEAQFELSYITKEQTKFNYLLANLEQNVVENIWDLVGDKSSRKYSIAKERLLSIFKTSEDRKINNLISELELGDLKPSQLLRKMRGLAGDNFSEKILKTLWMNKLPNYLQNILIVSDEEIDKLSEIADRIRDTKQIDEVHIRSEPQYQAPSTSDHHNLSEIQRLCDRIEALESRLSRNNSRFSGRSRSRSRSRPRFKENGDFCYFHFRFGNKCLPEKCKPPCKWFAGKENRQQ